MVLYLDSANPTNYNLTAVEVLVVAGGGGGGMDMGGGGGGGGVIYSSSVSVTPGSAVSVTVGNGGAGAPAAGTNGQPGGHQYTISATQGGNSVFGALTAIGGGFGASSYYGYTPNSGYGGTGGSGGGCSGYTHGGERYVDSNGTPGQGYPGGNSGNPASGGDDHYSGGGGGAGGRGTSGPNHVAPSGVRPDGGPGILYPTMSPYYFAGGGGGSAYTNSTGGYGGIGGGGGGAVGTTFGGAGLNNGSPGGGGSPNSQTNTPGGNAGANTGGGGGGGSHYNANNKGGDGGSGIVIVRYQGPQKAVGGTVTSVGGHTIHTFTTVGSTTFTPLVATNNSAIFGLSDLSGRGNFGTTANSPTYSSANGGSLSFDGTNDYISTPITGTFSQITFEFWGFFDDPTLSTTSRNESAFGDWNSNRVHFGTRWSVGMHFNVNSIWQTTPATNLRYGWNHYVLVYDTVSNQKLVYLNGILSSSNVTNGNMVLGDFRIGVATNLNAYYRGNISNFKVYNRALTAAEISQNFSALRGRYGI
jgi:hypothetical protein